MILFKDPVLLGALAYYLACMAASYALYRKSLLWEIGKYRLLFFSPLVAPTAMVAWVIGKIADHGKSESEKGNRDTTDLQVICAYGIVMFLYAQVAMFALTPLGSSRAPASSSSIKHECVEQDRFPLKGTQVPFWF